MDLNFSQENTTENIDQIIIEYEPGRIDYELTIKIYNKPESEISVNYEFETQKSEEEAEYTFNGSPMEFEVKANNALVFNSSISPGDEQVISVKILDPCGNDCIEWSSISFTPIGDHNSELSISTEVVNSGHNGFIFVSNLFFITVVILFSIPILIERSREKLRE